MNFVIDNFDALKTALGAMCAELDGLSENFKFNGKLVAMELVSNVLQHGGGRAYFSYTLSQEGLRISVQGEHLFRPPERSTLADVDAESGRGLYLVDSIVDRREYNAREGIVVVLTGKE